MEWVDLLGQINWSEYKPLIAIVALVLFFMFIQWLNAPTPTQRFRSVLLEVDEANNRIRIRAKKEWMVLKPVLKARDYAVLIKQQVDVIINTKTNLVISIDLVD